MIDKNYKKLINISNALHYYSDYELYLNKLEACNNENDINNIFSFIY